MTTLARMSDGSVLCVAERHVRFQDVDAAGIVFFARAFDLVHDVYVEHLRARGHDMARTLEQGPYVMPLVHAEADYKAPMRFGDAIRIELQRAEFGATSFTLFARIRSATDPRRVHCNTRTVHVVVDRADFRPVTVPDAIREALSPRS